MRHLIQRVGVLNGYSIELTKQLANTDWDQVSGNFFPSQVPTSNSAVGETNEVIMTKIYEVIHEVILLKIHNVQETFSEHENLAQRLETRWTID